MPEGFEHPDLARVGASMRSEWRAEEEQATRDALERWRRSRTIVDWFVERMNAGDVIAVTCSSQRFTGTVEEVGADAAGLRTPFARVDVHLGATTPMQVDVVERATSGGRRASLRRSFRDIVIARETVDAVTVGTTLSPEGLDGRVTAARDFVTLVTKDGAEVVVPMSDVTWIAVHAD
jgi:hypothetical protein